MKLVLASLSTFSPCFRMDTAQLLLPQSEDVSISQSSTLQTLTITHESCSLLLILSPFFSFFPLMHHTFDCPPPKQISAERGKSKPRPRKFSTRCRSVKLAWQYSLWGEGGSRSVASHSVRWTCTGGRAGEREKERIVSCESTVKRREGWWRAGTYRKTQEKNLKHRGERGWSRTVGEKWGGSRGRGTCDENKGHVGRCCTFKSSTREWESFLTVVQSCDTTGWTRYLI